MDLDVASIEQAEAAIDQFIDQRAREKEEANELSRIWAESEAKHNERLRRENRALWYEYHYNLANTYAGLSDDHALKAEVLRREGVA